MTDDERSERGTPDAFGRVCICSHPARKHGGYGCTAHRHVDNGVAVFPCGCLWSGLVQDDGVRLRIERDSLRSRAEAAERALADLRDSKVVPVVDLDNDALHRECRAALASEWERAYRTALEAAARDVCESPGRFAWTAQSSTAEQFGGWFAKYIRALPVPPRPEEGK